MKKGGERGRVGGREGGTEDGMEGGTDGGTERRRDGEREGGKEGWNPGEAGYQLVYYICIHLLDPQLSMPRQAVNSTQQQHKLSH